MIPCSAPHHTASTLARWAVWRAAHPAWVYVPRILVVCGKTLTLGAVLAVGPASLVGPALNPTPSIVGPALNPTPSIDVVPANFGLALATDGSMLSGYGPGLALAGGSYARNSGVVGARQQDEPAPIPEPMTLTLVASALLALAAARAPTGAAEWAR